MKAMCPICCGDINNNCTKCHGSGEIDVHFTEGNVWTRACDNSECGFENGGRIVQGDKEPPEPSGMCVMCKGTTHWLLIGEICHENIEDE
jgi:hypothetical protein